MMVARTVTSPAGTLRTVERPSALLDVTSAVPWMTTRAPASGWPDAWSVTCPATLPCCARATPPSNAPSASNAMHRRFTVVIDAPSSCGTDTTRTPTGGRRDGTAAPGESDDQHPHV